MDSCPNCCKPVPGVLPDVWKCPRCKVTTRKPKPLPKMAVWRDFDPYYMWEK